MHTLVKQSDRFDTSIPPVRPEAKKLFLEMVNEDYEGAQFAELVPMVKDLWADERIQKKYVSRAHNFQIFDSAPYFFEKIDQDMAKCLVRTTGMADAPIKLSRFKIVDTGGQRSERKKWICELRM
jgi:hypothetical protein